MANATLCDRAVLVTGGSGSFGRAFVRRALDEGAARVCIYSRGELLQAQFEAELIAEYPHLVGPNPPWRFFLGDVRDLARLNDAMCGIDIVVHAAALKRIEKCEDEAEEATKTNVDGTRNVATAAIAAGVHKAVFLSTDKAPVPFTTYGATKMLAERIWIGANVRAAGKGTIFACTRYGNVLESRGSVVHTWRQQSERGEPLTVTSSGMSRFFMSIGQAVDLVLLALERMQGGEVFIPRLPSCPLLTLAGAVAPGSTFTVVGTRGLEREHETLISEEEAPYTYVALDHYVIWPQRRSWGDALEPLYPRAPAGFSYTSDNNPSQFTEDELRELLS